MVSTLWSALGGEPGSLARLRVVLARRGRGERCAPPVRLSLARTAAELLGAPRPPAAPGKPSAAPDPSRHRVAFGRLSLIAPPGKLDGTPLRWAHGPRPFGGDRPAWAGPA